MPSTPRNPSEGSWTYSIVGPTYSGSPQRIPSTQRAEKSQAIRRLRARAERSAAKPSQRRWPRRFILFGPRVVPLVTFLFSEAQSHRNFAKDISRLTWELHKAERGLERRKHSLEKAHEYIVLLRDRLRAARIEIFDDYPAALNDEGQG